jgi:hypothetical protein
VNLALNLLNGAGFALQPPRWPSGKVIRSEAILLQVDKLSDPLHHEGHRGIVHIT